MTPTENLIAEARELDRRLKRAQKSSANMHEYGYAQDRFCDDAEKIIPALCDALEQAQATLEQTWEWDMYKCAQQEIDRLRKELEQVQNAQRWIPVEERLPEQPDNDNKRGWYSVHLESGCVMTLAFEFDTNRWHSTGSPVTHWMPLPEPPKGED